MQGRYLVIVCKFLSITISIINIWCFIIHLFFLSYILSYEALSGTCMLNVCKWLTIVNHNAIKMTRRTIAALL
jgi:hypothetical protein